MKAFLVMAAFAVIVVAENYQEFDTNEIDLSDDVAPIDWNEESSTPESYGLISWQVRRELKKIRKQLPCGFPEKGIPPLAPYRNEQFDVEIKRQFIEFISDFFRLQIDGLDGFRIKKFNVNILLKKVKYHFTFSRIRARSQKYNVSLFIDLMKELGLDFKYEGGGDLDFSLENISISGSFKFRMPLFWGSIRIYNLKCLLTLGNVDSNIGGVLGNGKINRYLNDKIEQYIVDFIADNSKEISRTIEENVETRVNDMLKGNKFWDLIGAGGIGNEKCIPPPDPWV